MKIFFRPLGLTGSLEKSAAALQFQYKDKKVIVTNPSGFYITVISAHIENNGRAYNLKPSMVPPFESAEWELHNPLRLKTLNYQ